jgi:hypothetical protein
MFGLTSFAFAVIILFLVAFGSHHKRLSTYPKHQTLVKVPVNNDEYVGYSDINVNSQRPSCSKSLIKITVPSAVIKSNLPIPSELESDVTSSVKAQLRLNKDGSLQYTLNGVDAWISSVPRTQIISTELNVLKTFAAKCPVRDWSFVSETDNGLRLHLSPLAITKKTAAGRQIVWTFFSGFDASALCRDTDCEIPYENAKENSEIVLMSKNRKYRLLFSTTGDLVIVEAGAESPRSSVFASKVKSSLMSSLCV